MGIRARGELLSITDKVALTATFYDGFGIPKNTDSFPKVSLVQPSGNVSMLPTSNGVQGLGNGKYQLTFNIPYAGPLGVWRDIWQGDINGTTSTQTLSFVVFDSNLYDVMSPDGYVHLGQDPGFHYSQIAIMNINKLLKTLRARLNSSGKMKITNPDGSVDYVDCDIFSVDTLITFLASSLSDINYVPHFTYFTFEDTGIIDLLHGLIVEGAVIYALGSQSLLERGNEFTIQDSGIGFNPPAMSELLNSQFGTLLTSHFEKIKLVKASMKPGPLGLGSATATNGNYLARRLSMLRARRMF